MLKSIQEELMLTSVLSFDNKNMIDVLDLRYKVFVEEQKVDASIEMDGYDEKATHVAVYDGTQIAGCGRVICEKGFAKLGRIAVRKDMRKQGIGSTVVDELINIARQRRAREILVYSQLGAVPFYEKKGFRKIGDPFEESGLMHVKMVYGAAKQKKNELAKDLLKEYERRY